MTTYNTNRLKQELLIAMRHDSKCGVPIHEEKKTLADELANDGLLAKSSEYGRYTITPIGQAQAELFEREWKGVSPEPLAYYEGLGAKLGVLVFIDDQLVYEESLHHAGDATRDVGNLIQLTLMVGKNAAHKLGGEDGRKQWLQEVVRLPRPGNENEQVKPIFDLLSNIANGTEKANGWTWHVRRYDQQIVFVKRDNDGTNSQSICVDPCYAYASAMRAHHYCRDTDRVFGSLLATFGIPFHNEDQAATLNDGTMPDVPTGVAEGECAVLSAMVRAGDSLLDHADRLKAEQRIAALSEHIAKTTVNDADDTAPEQAKLLAKELRLHPVRAQKLASWLCSGADKVALLAQALEQEKDHDRYAIDIMPPKPTWEQWRKDHDYNIGKDHASFRDDAHARKHFDGKRGPPRQWERQYGKTTIVRSNNLTKRAIKAMTFVWPGRDDSAEMWDEAQKCYEKRIKCESAEDAILLAVRPWPNEGWRGVEVGSTHFGRYKKWLGNGKRRRSSTPHDLYRLMYLFRPFHIDFTDMYKDGLFGIVSPCHRFAVSFYFNKYELAGYFHVEPELAKRTRPVGAIEIQCGIPGADNGVATTDKDALRWFRMISMALRRKWCVYGGNNFYV